jgi:replicative DNA helicase
MIALAVTSAAWLAAGLLVRPFYRSCNRCGFLYAFDGRDCAHCKRPIGAGRRLRAVLLWPLHFVRRVLHLRSLPPLHAHPARELLPGESLNDALRRAPDEVGAPEPACRIGTAIKDVFQELEAIREGKRRDVGISTGFTDLDALTSGLRPGSLTVIAGRPSMGKTGLAFAMIEQAVVREGKSVLLFTPEMSTEVVARRLLCSHARVSAYDVEQGRLSDDAYGRLVMAAGAFHETQLFVEDRPDLDLAYVAESLRRRQAQGLDLVVVDALHLMQRSFPWSNPALELRELARDCGVPIVVTAPVDRRAEFRSDHRPRAWELRGPGDIGVAADILLLLYRDEYYEPDSPLRGICEVELAINRFGHQGVVNLRFDLNCCRFANPLEHGKDPS